MTARGLIALRVAAIAATALYLVPTGAHLFEMRGKLALPMADYRWRRRRRCSGFSPIR